MRPTRRDVLVMFAAAPLAATWRPVQPAPAAARLLVHGRLTGESARGLQFGVAEASVTASLMRRELQLGTSAAGITGAIGVIAGRPPGEDDVPDGIPVLLLHEEPGGTGTCTFRVAPNETQRSAALARWKEEDPRTAGQAGDARVVAWHPSLSRYGAGELNDRYRKETGTGMTSDAWLAWFAVKALVDSALRWPGRAPCEALAAARLDGHKGRPLLFDPSTRVLRQPLYVVSAGEVVGEVVVEKPLENRMRS